MWAEIMTELTISDLDGYYRSPSALNNFHGCSREWLERYIIKKVVNPPSRWIFPMALGNRIHGIEDDNWNFIREFKLKFFPKIAATRTPKELARLLTKSKLNFMYSFENIHLKCIQNISMMDAVTYFQLKEHFDGSETQAFKYLIPLHNELEIYNNRDKTHVIIDNLSVIPAKFQGYKNKTDNVIIKDYKPGKFDQDGNVKYITNNREYDYGKFTRQLTSYLVEVDGLFFGDNKKPLPCRYVAAMYYRTNQYIVEKVDKRRLNPHEALVKKFNETSLFYRKKRTFNRHDYCEHFCDRRLTCRDKLKYWKGFDGIPLKLYKFCVKGKCKKCGETFVIARSWYHENKPKYKRCHSCRELQEEKKASTV
jgi:hypothetical protein